VEGLPQVEEPDESRILLIFERLGLAIECSGL